MHAMVYLGGGIFGLGLLLTLGLAVTACVFERRDGNRVGQLHADGEGYGGQHNQQQQQQQEFQQGQGQYGHHYGVVQDVQGKGQDAWGGGTWVSGAVSRGDLQRGRVPDCRGSGTLFAVSRWDSSWRRPSAW